MKKINLLVKGSAGADKTRVCAVLDSEVYLEYPEAVRSEKRRKKTGFFLPKRLTILYQYYFEGLWLVGT